MTNEEQRRVRLRLARRRTTPDRVRARVRQEPLQPQPDTEPEPQPESRPEPEPRSARNRWWRRVAERVGRWRRRVPWVHVGAVSGAITAIGSLAFTGVATYFSAVVASDQLEQSEKAADQQAKAQAVQVAAWDEAPQGEQPRVSVMNRSADPVTTVTLYFALDVHGEHGGDIDSLSYEIKLTSVPPAL